MNLRHMLYALATVLCLCTVAKAGEPHIIFVFDASSSMGEHNKLAQAKKALTRSVEMLPANSQIGLLVFSDHYEWIYMPSEINIGNFKASVDRIRANGGTALGNTLVEASNVLAKIQESTSNHEQSTFQIVALTDGENTQGQNPTRVVPLFTRRSQRVDVIGIEMNDRSLARALSEAGFKNSYHTADKVEDLFAVLKVVLKLEEIQVDASGVSDLDVLEPVDTDVALALIAAVVTASKAPASAKRDNSNSRQTLEDQAPQSGGCQAVPGSRLSNTDMALNVLLGMVLGLFVLLLLPRRRKCPIFRRSNRRQSPDDRP